MIRLAEAERQAVVFALGRWAEALAAAGRVAEAERVADLAGRFRVRRSRHGLADAAVVGDGGHVSRQQAADALGCSTSTIDRAIRAGRLPARRFGRRVLIPTAALEGTPDDC